MDQQCQALIRQRIQDGLADPAPIAADVCEFEPVQSTHGLMGGFPRQASIDDLTCIAKKIKNIADDGDCVKLLQDISGAGEGKGMAGQRLSLLRRFFRIWDKMNPKPILDSTCLIPSNRNMKQPP